MGETREEEVRRLALKLCDIVDDLIACPRPWKFRLETWVPTADLAESELRKALAALPTPEDPTDG